MDSNSLRKLIKISWQTYLNLIKEVHRQVVESDFLPDHVVAVSRGGLTIGERISYLLNKPLVVMAAENWPEGRRASEVKFSRHCVFTTPTVSGKILLVDDLTETGDTLQHGKEYLVSKFPEITEIKTATLFHKTSSKFKPDYLGMELGPDETGLVPWILKPTENPDIFFQGEE